MTLCILGTGAVGMSLIEHATKAGHNIIAVNRSGVFSDGVTEGRSIIAGDISQPEAIAAKLPKVDWVIHAAGLPMNQWEPGLRNLMEGAIKLARDSSAKFAYVDMLWAIGNNMGRPMSEASPEQPTTWKEILRAELAQRVRKAFAAGDLDGFVARAPDLYGPRVREGVLGQAFFEGIVQGKSVRLLGEIDMPHSFIYVKDLAKSILQLMENDNAMGKVWHVPSPQPISQRQAFDIVREMQTKSVKLTVTGFGFSSMFDEEAKFWKDMRYLWENPWVVNHSRFASTFGERCTSHEQALWETLDWYQRKSGEARRYGH